MAQVSNMETDFPSREDQSEEDTKRSLLHTVKDKAKGTVRKLTGKKKRASGEADDRRTRLSGESKDSDEDMETSSSDNQSLASKGDSQPAKSSIDMEPQDILGGKTEGDMLSSFARSGSSENSPLVAVPTSYSDPTTLVEDVMPAPVIQPQSVSDLGEESSASLGKIPEAKEEEKACVVKDAEARSGLPISDKAGASTETFKQKDLRAIDGLPKPIGFDISNQDSVKSDDFKAVVREELGQ